MTTINTSFGCNQEIPNITYSHQEDDEYLLLNYFDVRGRLNFTVKIVRKDQDIEIRLNFFSPHKGGSRWLDEYVNNLDGFTNFVQSWYTPQDKDPEDMLNIYDIFKPEIMSKFVQASSYQIDEVVEAYNKVGVVLRRVVLYLCRDRKFVEANGKVTSKKYKPTPEGKVRKQRELKTY
jgi:hypothetical protein